MPPNNRKPPSPPPCKFFAQGACLKGENCKFLHDHHRKDQPKNICKFYQKGFCPFASHCKYQHVQTSWINKSSSSSAAAAAAASSSSSSSSSSSTTTTTTKIPSNTSGHKNNHCLHPHKVEVEVEVEVEERTSEQNQKQLEALRCSQEIECSVCLDRVLSKPTPAERRFAVLPECDHPFCISCIRNWRKSSPNSAVRACPICRKLSHFVVPSLVWYSCKEEKQDIIDNYKAKLRSIDCKHFDFGNGNCPFGVNCFYKHTIKPGSYTWKYQRPPPRGPLCHRSSVADMDASFDLFEHLMEEDLLAFSDTEDFYEDILEQLDDEEDDGDDDDEFDFYHEYGIYDEFDIYDARGFYHEKGSPFDMALLFAQLDPSDVSSDEENSLF